MPDRRRQKKKGPSKGPPRPVTANSQQSSVPPENAGAAAVKANVVPPGAQVAPDDQLDRELSWCIGQLDLGLQKQKPTPRQVEETMKALKTLTNPKAPLIKKRQLMRNLFGDYRSKMAEEEKKFGTDPKKIKFKSAESCKAQKAVFYKKSTHGETNSEVPEKVSDSSEFKFTPSDNSFKFSFNNNDTGSSQVTASGDTSVANESADSAKSCDIPTANHSTETAGSGDPEAAKESAAISKTKTSGDKKQSSSYKMPTGGGGYKFGFPDPGVS